MTSLALLACGGGDDGVAVDATPPAATSRPEIRAQNFKFDLKAISVPANSQVSLTLDNRDAGVLHNVSIYTDKSAKEKIFVGELFNGLKSLTYMFTAPSAGTYFFRCDAHPDMNGAFYSVEAGGTPTPY